MKKLLIILICLIAPNMGIAEGFKTEKEIRAFSDKFMDQIIKANFKKAFDSTKSVWPLPEVEIDGIVNKIKQQWPMIENRFGMPVDKEWIKEKRIGKSFLRYYYLHKFENHSIYWYIDFYKPRDLWLINRVLFRDNLDVLFE